ncbi:MAG: hypothetical protein WCT04_20475 [Planctomycetota bacterium]
MPTTTQITYVFKFNDGREHRVTTELDSATQAIIAKPNDALPEWTALGFNKCAGCPLSVADHPRCPVAVNLVEIVDLFKEFFSYEEVHVTVETDDRTYAKQTSLEDALVSLLDLYLSGSGCPVMDKMRPTLDCHVPFPSPNDISNRMLRIYLVTHYLLSKSDKPMELESERIAEFIRTMQDVNAAFLQRLKAVAKKDALRNSMVVSNNLLALAARSATSAKMKSFEQLYQTIWK